MKVRKSVVMLAVLAGLTVTALGVASPADPIDCKGKAFPWYRSCWSAGKGRAFAAELDRHGVEPERFKKRHPGLAAMFAGKWPPEAARWSEEWLRARINAAWPREGEWDRIAVCETGSNWQHANSSYQGGVGFATASWDGWRPAHFPAEAWQATRLQQMWVAERIYDDYGLSGWGCRGSA